MHVDYVCIYIVIYIYVGFGWTDDAKHCFVMFCTLWEYMGAYFVEATISVSWDGLTWLP